MFSVWTVAVWWNDGRYDAKTVHARDEDHALCRAFGEGITDRCWQIAVWPEGCTRATRIVRTSGRWKHREGL